MNLEICARIRQSMNVEPSIAVTSMVVSAGFAQSIAAFDASFMTVMSLGRLFALSARQKWHAVAGSAA